MCAIRQSCHCVEILDRTNSVLDTPHFGDVLHGHDERALETAHISIGHLAFEMQHARALMRDDAGVDAETTVITRRLPNDVANSSTKRRARPTALLNESL